MPLHPRPCRGCPSAPAGPILWPALVFACVVLGAALATDVSGATIGVPGDQPTIQDAVDAAAPGDTIRVAPGDYHEQVLVTGAKDGLTIEAADPADPPIVHGAPNVSQDGIRVDGIDGVTIRNIQIIGAYNGVRLNNVTDGLLTGLYIEDNALGIRVYLGQDNRVEQCTIVHTRVEQGIFVNSSPGIVLSQNVVTDAAHGGIGVQNSSCATLVGNQAIDSRGTDGIKIDDCDGARVQGCTATGSYRDGFRLSNTHGLTLLDNTADDNLSVGLRIDRCAPIATVADVTDGGNSASGNPQGAILVSPADPGSGSSVVCPSVATPTPPAPTPSSATASPTPTTGASGTATTTATPGSATASPTPTAGASGTATTTATPGSATASPTPTASVSGTATTTATPGNATASPTPTAVASGTPGPPATATAVMTATEPVPTPSSTPAPADPDRCRKAVARAGAAFAKAKIAAVRRCEERLLGGKLGPDPGPGARLPYCLADIRTAAKITRARGRLAAAIDRSCGGANDLCGDADDNLDMQGDLGFPETCPDLDAAGCTNVLTDCREVADCLGCIHDAATDSAIALSYDDLIPGAAAVSRSLAKCQQALGKETVKYQLARTKALGKCWHDRFKGRHADTCPTLDTQASLHRAAERRIAKLCRACGGEDRQCDAVVRTVDPGLPALGGSAAGDDLMPSDIGFVATCPDVTTPANALHGPVDCGGPVATLADLVFCAGCVTQFAVDCSDRSGLPSLAPYPPACHPPMATPGP